MQCADCNSVKVFAIPSEGDGICSECHGGGVGGFWDELADGTNPFGRGHIKCYKCGGSGECPTCDGTGVVDDDD